MSEPTFVSADGRPFDLGAAQAKAAVQPKRSRVNVTARKGIEHEDFMSLGFVVEGLTHEMLADARDARRKAIDGYDEACDRAREAHAPLPKRPLPFDEEQWMLTAKRKRVTSRPFEIRSSAETCRELALKQGFLDVRITELRRERK